MLSTRDGSSVCVQSHHYQEQTRKLPDQIPTEFVQERYNSLSSGSETERLITLEVLRDSNPHRVTRNSIRIGLILQNLFYIKFEPNSQHITHL